MHDQAQKPENLVIENLVNHYNTPVPRYTSYPTAVEFQADFKSGIYFNALKKMAPEQPVSVYVHIPFCEQRCHYCGCNVIINRRKELIDIFLNDLKTEIRFKQSFIPFKPKVSQLHFGGGTPNFLRKKDWDDLMGFLRDHFEFMPSREQSVELDPMVMNQDYLQFLRQHEFNRVSFGIQDVNEATQKAVNRIQNMGHINNLFEKSREFGFSSVNADFIYGLPYQNEKNYQANIDWIKQYRPDRMAMFSYAHIPWIKKHQANMAVETMPSAQEKLRIYLAVEEQLHEAGYVSIGLDHFALENDPLSQALKNKKLHRNFMGYTTQPDLDQLAFGPSAISFVQGVYAQNHVKLKAYEKSARQDSQDDWFEKGVEMTAEDYIHNHIIQSIMNNLFLDIGQCNRKWGINFFEKFQAEVDHLREFEKDGLLHIDSEKIEILTKGRYVVRHIARVFDAYRKASEEQRPRFSKGI